MFERVLQFEKSIAQFYNAPYAVATDSCTHAIELAIRYKKIYCAYCPNHTYLSIPMTFMKLDLEWKFVDSEWERFYNISDNIIDAAVFWQENGYIPGTFMCLSFQFKKHLSLGRGGAILCDNKQDYDILKKMSYDGRSPHEPWATQNIDTLGFHYYMTPETAELGLTKLSKAKDKISKIWTWKDYPDLKNMKIFNIEINDVN
jgi:dTDP-4-amino-4,6-dideoxygalactose transaminase